MNPGVNLITNFLSRVASLLCISTNQNIFNESRDFLSPSDWLSFRVELLLYSESSLRDWLFGFDQLLSFALKTSSQHCVSINTAES